MPGIDPTVPQPARLEYDVPNVPSPLDTMGKVMTLKSLAQEGQIHAQQIQAMQLENQQRQLDLSDQQAMRSRMPALLADPTYRDGDGNPNWTKIATDLAPHVSAKTAQALYKNAADSQEKVALIRKTTADTQKTQNEVAEQHGDLVAGWMGGVKNSGYSQATWDFTLAQARALYRGDPAHLQQIDALEAGAKQYGIQPIADAVANQISDKKRNSMAAAQTAQARADQAATTAANSRRAAEKDAREAPGQAADAQSKARDAAAVPLANAADKGKHLYTREWNNLNAKDPRTAALFPAPDAYDEESTPAEVRKLGTSIAQQNTADNQVTTRADTEARDEETAAYHRGMLGVADRNASTNEQRADQSAGALNQAVEAQLSRAIADNSKGGSTNLKDALRNVQQSYQGDPDMEAVRGKVIDRLQKMIAPPKGVSGASGMQEFRNISAGRQPNQNGGGTPKQPAKPATPGAGTQTWKVGNQTFTAGQIVYSNGQAHKITGYNAKTGKLIASPVN